METRQEDRVGVERPIVLTILGETETHQAATVKDASARGLGVVTSAAVKPGAAVKIEIGDVMLLGEAVFCRPLEGRWFVGIKLTQALTGLEALNKMAQAFEAELHPAPRAKLTSRA